MACALPSRPLLAQPAAPGGTDGSTTPAETPVAADTIRRYRLDIPGQPLADALTAFAAQTGVRVQVDGFVVARDVRSQAVSGVLRAHDALRILLGGTGYTARFADDAVVVVARPPRGHEVQALRPVVVVATTGRSSGYTARRTVSATKTDLPLRDVPQAVTVIGRELLEDQAMQSMADVARFVPGITMGQGEGHRDAPTIRGNASTADFFVDGVRDDVQYFRDLYNVERVEALKGPNAMIFGRGGGGGVINRVTKEAQWVPTRTLTVEGGSFGHKRATLDVGDGIGPLAAARLTSMAEDSRRFRDATGLERHGINPTAAVLAGGALVRLGYEYFADRRTVDRGIPSFQGRPSAAAIETFFGDPDASRARAVVHAAGATVDWSSVRGVGLRNRTRFVDYDKFYQNVFPGAVNDAGTEVRLSAYNNGTRRRNLFNQTDLTFALPLGAVRQTLLLGVELGRQTTDNHRETGYFAGDSTSIGVAFARPTVAVPVTFRQSASDADNRVTAGVIAAYAQSQLAIGAHWQAILGVRHDRFALDVRDHRSGNRIGRDDHMLSPRAGLVFKPAEAVSLYAAHTISHLPSSGDQFASLSATTRTLEPERFTNREVGLKWEPRGDVVATGALYRLDRTNTSAPDPTDPARVVQTGHQRTVGVELGLVGSLTSGWQVAGGYARQRATLESRTAAAPAGATVPLVPGHTFSLWSKHRLARGLAAGLGVVHGADMYAAIDNTVTLPGFTRVDGALYLSLGRGLRAQMNVENLLDERYYPTSHGNNNIMPGAPRTIRVSISGSP